MMDELRVVGPELYFNSYKLGERPASMCETTWGMVEDAIDDVVEYKLSTNDDGDAVAFDLDEFLNEMHRAGLQLLSITKDLDKDYVVSWVSHDGKFSYVKFGSILSLAEALQTSGDAAIGVLKESLRKESEKKDCF